MKRLKSKIKALESGQMLLFVLVIMMLLLIIVLAIVTNIRTDMQAVQQEQNYEKGYAEAEDILLDINSDSFDAWKGENSGIVNCWSDPSSIPIEINSTYRDKLGNFCKLSGVDDSLKMDECCFVTGLGEDGEGMAIIKRKLWNDIHDMSVDRDKTIEVDLTGASGALLVSWSEAPAMSAMLVCKKSSGDFYNIRMAVCQSGEDVCDPLADQGGFKNISEARTSGPFNMNLCDVGDSEPVLLRLRAIGEAATNISVYSENDSLPNQMDEVRVQSFPSGIELAEDIPAPELQSLIMLYKRMPSLFDYVLFVSEGEVRK